MLLLKMDGQGSATALRLRTHKQSAPYCVVGCRSRASTSWVRAVVLNRTALDPNVIGRWCDPDSKIAATPFPAKDWMRPHGGTGAVVHHGREGS